MKREELLEHIREYYRENFPEKEFIKGETKIPFAGRVFDSEELVNLIDSSLDFWLTSGRYAQEFETRFAEFMEQKTCLLVNSGSSANLIALTSLTSPFLKSQRLEKGDEVITVAAGFPTTVNPIIQNGLVPVFVDCDIETFNIDINQLEQALSPKTRAIMLAHTLGNPFDLDYITGFCRENNLYLIEDCCDAVGSKYNDKMVGGFGDIATTSFYPAHHITMGEGGSVLTSNPHLKRIAASIRDWGRDCYCDGGFDNTCGLRFKGQYGNLPKGYDHKYVYSHIGYNLKLTDMQASIGVAQLDKLPKFIFQRKDNFNKLLSGLKKHEDKLIFAKPTPKSNPSWFGFPFNIRENNHFSRRDLAEYLEKNNILTRQLFAGNLTKQPAYLDKEVKFRISGNLDKTDYIMNNTIFIGVYPGIDSQRIDYIIEVFDNFFSKL